MGLSPIPGATRALGSDMRRPAAIESPVSPREAKPGRSNEAALDIGRGPDSGLVGLAKNRSSAPSAERCCRPHHRYGDG